MEIKDSLIVDQLKRESTLGITNLVGKYQYFLRRWGRWHYEIIDEEDLIQIIQDTFMRILENIETFELKTQNGFRNWIITIFSRLCLDHIRKEQRVTKRIKFESLDAAQNGNDDASYNPVKLELDKKISHEYFSHESKEHPLAAKVRDFMDGLDDKNRIIIYSCATGIPHREIAKWVEIPVDHVRVYYSRLKKRLERYLIETKGV